ncbi:MAG: hypothetical protein JWQ07_1117 [Ramlibacter sp.]|nr:hypothetical protein [Ramlibacter sp.]
MNNSFDRLIDGMCATLRAEVLTRLDDDFARGQVYGVINLLNTFKVRADWSGEFLLEQLAIQRAALMEASELLKDHVARTELPTIAQVPAFTPISKLLAQRDEGNQAISDLLARLPEGAVSRIEPVLLRAMRAEVEIELKNSPRPLFAQMSSGKES